MIDASTSTTGRPTAPLLRAAELQLWGEAEAALRRARQCAKRVRAEARTAAAQERERGYAEGHAAGAEQVARIVASASAAAEAMLRRIETELPELVHGIVEGVLGAFPVAELVTPAVRHALGRVRLDASSTLRAAPDDAAALRTVLDEAPGGTLVRLEPDPALDPGRCVLSGEFGTVELGVAAQLRALQETLASTPEILEQEAQP